MATPGADQAYKEGKMEKQHKLKIISLYDGQATCSCNWYFAQTGPVMREAVEAEWLKHLKGIRFSKRLHVAIPARS